MARRDIDKLLVAAGWSVQDRDQVNLGASRGVAVRYFQLKEQAEADYMLFVDRKAAGVLEAKPEGVTLSGVAEQTERYLHLLPDGLPSFGSPLPFAYESTGVETFFRDGRDPDARSRRVFSFHTPDELGTWLEKPDTLRGRFSCLPALDDPRLYGCRWRPFVALRRRSSYTSRVRWSKWRLALERRLLRFPKSTA